MKYLLILLFLFSCSKSNENTVNIYSSVDAKETAHYVKKFEKDTGIKVNWVRMSTGETLARLLAEKNSPQVSVWFGGTSPEFITATKRGLLEAYKPAVSYELDSNQRDKDYHWTGIYFGAIGFATNDKLIKDLGVSAPRSWDDLLKPEFKGKVSMAYPYTSGTAYTVVSSILQMMGEQKGWAFIKNLNSQIHHYNKSGSAAVTQAGIGEIAVGISFSHDILKKGKGAGYPVTLSFPNEGTGFEVGAMALVKNGPNNALGKKFIDYFASTKGQSEFNNYYRVALNPGIIPSEGMIKRSEVNLIDFDASKAANEQARVIEQWKTTVTN